MPDFINVLNYELTATIANGATTSPAVDLGGYALIGLLMPAAFTGTTITFQMSPDNSTFYDVYNTSGTQGSVTVAASRAVIFAAGDFIGERFVKLISGSTEGGARVIKLIARKLS